MAEAGYTPRLKTQFDQTIRAELTKQFGYANVMQVPVLDKVVINMGVGEATQDKKHLETAVEALTQISGQKPIITKARKSIAGFRLREGQSIGAKVTLRRQRMYEFLDRLIAVALPRVRDFRGVSDTAFDGKGNYSLGLTEQLVFPELNPDKFLKVQGMNISFVTSTDSNDEARELLRLFGMPFRQADTAAGVA